ncbi:universal stress protein [Muricauda sp. MAR_2010_75]|uniref:universal stress protein n=1 Tax=Allomuricauda sp. MAR_2010_75 TaxID=1250232 RepID=UPI000ABA2123|nr:universal stress protein [Muricauda sp. MAR_2010_75]
MASGVKTLESTFSFPWKSQVHLTADMSIMKNILVPVDFSEHSAYALEVASQIAKKHGAGIIILHMLGLSESVLAKSEEEELKEAKYYMNLARERIKEFTKKEFLENISVDAIIQNYKIFSEVDHVAQEHNCDLIVMGSHGASGLSKLFVGSNTEKVIRTSKVPVLVIKQPHKDFNIKKMAFACDLDVENIPAYTKAVAFAQLFSAKLETFYVNTLGANYMGYSDIEKKIKYFTHKLGEEIPIRVYNHYSVEKGIFNFCVEHNIDLLVIPTHGRKGIAHFLAGSTAENVSNHAKLPVLTLKL